MRISSSIGVLCVLAWATAVAAQEPKLAREHHVWARFQPGAWAKVRVTTETLDENGKVTGTSATETTTRLDDVTNDSYELQVEIAVEVAGKQFKAEPQYVSQSYLGEPAEQKPVVKKGDATTVSIENKRIPCQVFTVETNAEDQRRVMKIYYADGVEPHMLRKQSVATDPAGTNTLYESDEAVVAVDMPYKVLTQVVPASVVKTVRQNAKGSTITLAVQTAKVPGGVVSHTSKELDASGRVIRRSTLELVAYGVDGGSDWVGRRHFKNRRRR